MRKEALSAEQADEHAQREQCQREGDCAALSRRQIQIGGFVQGSVRARKRRLVVSFLHVVRGTP